MTAQQPAGKSLFGDKTSRSGEGKVLTLDRWVYLMQLFSAPVDDDGCCYFLQQLFACSEINISQEDTKDGKKEPDDIFAIKPDFTISYTGFVGHMHFRMKAADAGNRITLYQFRIHRNGQISKALINLKA